MLILCLLVSTYLAYGYLRNKRHIKDIYNKKGKLVYLTYGLPLEGDRENADWVIANKWGFTYKRVAGCTVTTQLLDSVNAHNDLVFLVLTKRFGKNWNDKFAFEADAEYKREQVVAKLVRNEDFIIKTQALLKEEGNGLHFKMDPINNTTQYDVRASGWNMGPGKVEWVNYYKLKVDYKSGKVILLSDKIEK